MLAGRAGGGGGFAGFGVGYPPAGAGLELHRALRVLAGRPDGAAPRLRGRRRRRCGHLERLLALVLLRLTPSRSPMADSASLPAERYALLIPAAEPAAPTGACIGYVLSTGTAPQSAIPTVPLSGPVQFPKLRRINPGVPIATVFDFPPLSRTSRVCAPHYRDAIKRFSPTSRRPSHIPRREHAIAAAKQPVQTPAVYKKWNSLHNRLALSAAITPHAESVQVSSVDRVFCWLKADRGAAQLVGSPFMSLKWRQRQSDP